MTSQTHLPAQPRIAEIQAAVARRFGLTMAELLCPRRSARYAHPRQLAMLLARQLTHRTTGELGRAFNRDHTTIIEGARRAAARIDHDCGLAEVAEQLTATLTSMRCRCQACAAGFAAFPLDPPQLLLPLGWPGELPLEVAA